MESNTSVEVEGVEVGREKRVCRSGVRESEQPLIGRERPVTAGRPQSLQVKVSRKKKKKKEDQIFNWDGETKRNGGFKTIVGEMGGMIQWWASHLSDISYTLFYTHTNPI